MVSGVSPGWMMRAVMPSVQAEAETRKRVRLHVGAGPVAGRELVLDQAVGGGGIGHPQQRLRQHHQGEALLGGKRIGMQEILDPAEPAGPAADALDQPGGAGIDPCARPRRPRRLRQQACRAIASSGGA